MSGENEISAIQVELEYCDKLQERRSQLRKTDFPNLEPTPALRDNKFGSVLQSSFAFIQGDDKLQFFGFKGKRPQSIFGHQRAQLLQNILMS